MKKKLYSLPCVLVAICFTTSLQAQEGEKDTTEVSQIKEVVMIGYGSAQKRDLTGSIASVKGDEVADKPAANPINSLQGKVAGLSIVNSGQPGSQADVRIRGTVTHNQTQPVYIVDGVFVNNIDFVNPTDIKSIEVLKDPSSLAIFGSRGANGAIIITTKQGETGKTTITLNSTVGIKSLDNRPDLTNAAQFRTLYNEDLANQGLPAYELFNIFNADTNWINVIKNEGAMVQRHSINFSSGTRKNKVNFSFGYTQEDGSIKYEKYSRLTFGFNDDLQISKNFKAGIGLNGSYSKLPQLHSFNSALNATPVVAPINTQAGPYYGLYNSLPQQLGAAQIGNPLAAIEAFKYTQRNKDFQFNPNAYFEFKFWKNFTFRSNYFVNYRNGTGRGYTPIFDVYVAETNSTTPYAGNILTGISQFENRDVSFQQNQLLTYKNRFGHGHDITAMIGFETVNRKYTSLSGSAKGSPSNPLGQIPNNPRFWYLNSDFVDPATKEVTTDQFSVRQVSYFGRILYNYQRKYLLTASIRNDGSSWLAPGHRFDWFWAVGAGWVISREDFMKDIDFIDYLKIKGSYGDLGNQYVNGTRYFGYPVLVEGGTGVFNGHIYPAFIKEFQENPNLSWEHLKSYEFGLESHLFNNRFSLNATYYHKKTEDLLYFIPGNPSSFENGGSIQAKGLELSLGWNDKIGNDFGYYINGNITTTKTKVLNTVKEGYVQYFGPSIYKEGAPIGSFYGYIVDGLYQSYADILASPPTTIGDVAPGDFKYKDVNGDGIITPDDRTLIGDPTPDFTYGFSVGTNYKGFFLNMDFYGVYGNEVFRNWGNGNSFAPFNYRAERMGRWTGPGTSNWEPRSYSASGYNRENSTYMIEDGSFFRIRNVQVGYNFNHQLISGIGLQALKVYFNVQNLKTWDHVNGFTPEFGGSATEFGVNNSGYPTPRIMSFGVDATF